MGGASDLGTHWKRHHRHDVCSVHYSAILGRLQGPCRSCQTCGRGHDLWTNFDQLLQCQVGNDFVGIIVFITGKYKVGFV